MKLKNKKTPKLFLTFESILQQIQEYVYDSHGLRYTQQIRIVRQKRDVLNSKLKFVDYAIPCFEVADFLHIQPEQFAHDVSQYLSSKTENNELYFFEAVDGYLNIQITQKAFAEHINVSKSKIKLGKSSSLMVNNRPKIILIDLLGFDNKYEMQLSTHVKRILKKIYNNSGFDLQFAKTNKVTGRYIKKISNATLEKNNMHLYKDTNTFAVHIEHKTEHYALISSRGTVLAHGQILETLAKYSSQSIKVESFILLVPRLFQEAVQSYITILTNENFQKRVHIFDPIISKADVLEILSNFDRLKGLNSLIENVIQNNGVYLQSAKSRRHLLTVIDYPIEIYGHISSTNVPATLECTNNMLTALHELSLIEN